MNVKAFLLAGCCSLPFAALIPKDVQAQSAPVPPPVFRTIDSHGVDLVSGRIAMSLASVQIGGDGPGGLSFSFDLDLPTSGNSISYVSLSSLSGGTAYVVAGQKTVSFSQNGQFGSATYSQDQGLPVSLNYDSATSSLNFTDEAGTVFMFDCQNLSPVSSGPLSTKIYRNGLSERYYYVNLTSTLPNGSSGSNTFIRSITNSLGYQLKVSQSQINGVWYNTSAVAFNMATETCDPTAAACNLAGQWPAASRDPSTGNYTDSVGRSVRMTGDGSSYYTLQYDSGRQITYRGYFTNSATGSYFKILSFFDGRSTWQYRYGSIYSPTTLVFDPDNSAPKAYQFTGAGRPSIIQNAANDTPSAMQQWTYDGYNRPVKITTSDRQNSSNQRVVTYAYDARGNLTEQRLVSSNPAAYPDIVLTAHYPVTCSDPGVCNKPDYTVDAASQRTDYTYDPGSGDVASVTSPAAGAGSVRPQTRYSYSPLAATFHSGSGATVTGDQVYLPTRVSQCRTAASCTGGNDETVTTLAYNGNNALTPSSVTTAAGDGSVSSTVTTTFTGAGDIQTRDGPLSGTGDTTRWYYDSMRRKIGSIGPDPDASGPRQRAAVQVGYAPDGQIATTVTGTASGQGDGDLAAMVPAQTVSNSYDAQGRPVQTTLSAGGTPVSVTQQSYDDAGLLQCTAIRMNASAFQSLPSSACSLGTTGVNGPDRITQYTYDAAFRVKSVTQGVGTSSPVLERSLAYTPFGETASLTDANGNQTNYAYDGFGRLQQTVFPGGSSEQIAYDGVGRLTGRTLRDGQTIGYAYDNLGRLVSKDRPNAVYWETDQGFGYDLEGHLTQASDSNGRSLTFGYDALGRRVSQNDNWYGWGNAAFQYDAAGHRTRLTWNDGLSVSYDYDASGAMSAIRDGGGSALVTFGHDDLGRRTSLSRANGTGTGYAYDAVSQLSGVTLSGGNQPQAIGLSYNPAGQIVGRTASNDAYAWTGGYNVDRSYGVNGLNQLTNAGGTALGYDARGNLTQSGGTGYGYTVDNQLATVPGANLAYDPLGRLFNVNAENGVNTTLLYDGADVIAEIDQASGALLRRYVQGPGSDEPLIWYEGSGTGDRRWLHADERGSIVAVTNDAGTAIAVNSYDEFGIPAANNIGRFQYTGQKWLTGIGLYDYKARMYSPTLGRFMQTDPIGYGDGPNMYNYVGSDPVNNTDPTGLSCRGRSTDCDYTDAAGNQWRMSGVEVQDEKGNVTGTSYGYRLIGNDGSYLSSMNWFNTFSVLASVSGLAQMPIPDTGGAPQNTEQCSGPRITYSYGGSATAAALIGVGLGASVTIGVPTSFSWSDALKGVQISLSGTGSVMAGYGIFAGGGSQHTVGITSTAATSGTSHSYFVEGDAGWGPSVGGNIQVNSPLGSGASGAIGGKVGLGIGLYAGVGKSGTATYAFKPIGC